MKRWRRSQVRQTPTRQMGRTFVSPNLAFVVLVWLAIALMILLDFQPALVVGFPVFLIAGAGICSGLARRRKNRRVPPGHCQSCGYDLTGNVTGICSECGAACSSDPEGNCSHARTIPRPILTASILVSIVAWLSHVHLLNMGFSFGYYGQLNRVKGSLESIPNLEIRGVRGNYDVRLEDFTFDVTMNGRHDASLYFHEPPSPSWQLFNSADGLMVRCRKRGSFDTWESAHHWWWFPLGSDADLEKKLGCEMRNLHDVFTHFGEIMQLIEATPVDILDRQHKRTNSEANQVYLVVGIPYPSCESEWREP